MTTPTWVPLAAGWALIVSLYVSKAAALRRGPAGRAAAWWFVPQLALAVPLAWATDPDWDNINLYPVMIWVGGPIAVLAVPAVSFVCDLWVLHHLGRTSSWWRWLLELLIAVPVWVYFWTFFSFWVLGWGWI